MAETACSSPKIIALNGAPHRAGNTVTLMEWVAQGCRAAGAEVEWVHIVDHDVRYCQGCFTCLSKGECPIRDDFLALRARLLAADGIIAGSPVYEGGPTAQMKTFLDRVALLNLYTHVFEQQFSVGVATSGMAPTGQVARDLADMLGRSCGTIGARVASVACGYQPLADVHPARLPRKARTLGRRLVADIRAKRHKRSLKWMWINFLRRFLMHPLLIRYPAQFAGVIVVWRDKGWLKEPLA